jgi:hypothetical protein
LKKVEWKELSKRSILILKILSDMPDKKGKTSMYDLSKMDRLLAE